MKTKAVRIYGKRDLRLEEFELPELREDEILANVISDSICMSSHKAALIGSDHRRVPENININPTIIGHEFAGVIVEVGKRWKDKFYAGQKFTVQPALSQTGNLLAAGYSFQYLGGDATYIIIPSIVIESDCLIPYNGEAFYPASLSEPMSCIIGAFHASYHTRQGSYIHDMGFRDRGKMAILGGAGPMGLGAIDYALHQERKPELLVVTDKDETRLSRASRIFSPEEAKKHDITLLYINTLRSPDVVTYLKGLTGGSGFDDVFVFAPTGDIVEQGDAILGYDGCLNFFSGPTDNQFKAELNFYNIHYNSTHVTGTSGGTADDMREALMLISDRKINPAIMITHIGGLDAVIQSTYDLPQLPGGKKLIYTNISMPLIALDELDFYGKSNKLFDGLNSILSMNNYIWSPEAEKYLLANAKPI